jgi:hypothetical protein
MVEDDAFDVRATLLETCCCAFVGPIDLDVVCEFPLAFHAMPEGLTATLIAIAMVLQDTSPFFGERDRVLARARYSNGLNQSLLPEVSQVARPGIERAIVLVPEITTGDHLKHSDGRERSRLRTAQGVLAIAVAYEFAFRAAGEIQVPRERLARVTRTVRSVVLAIRPARIVAGIVSSITRIRLAGTPRTLTK